MKEISPWRGTPILTRIALFSFSAALSLLVAVLVSRAVSFWIVGRSDPAEWREFFVFRTGVIWTLACGGVGLCVMVATALWLLNSKAQSLQFVSSWLAVAALSISFLILTDILIPGTSVAEVPGVVVQTMPTPAAAVPEAQRGFAVYFSNGDSRVRDVSTVAQLFGAARSCGAKTLEIIAYCSSAPYAKNDAQENIKLANNRANSVAKLAILSKLSPIVHQWDLDDFQLLQQSRGYIDRINGSRSADIEILNRRADISFKCAPQNGSSNVRR